MVQEKGFGLTLWGFWGINLFVLSETLLNFREIYYYYSAGRGLETAARGASSGAIKTSMSLLGTGMEDEKWSIFIGKKIKKERLPYLLCLSIGVFIINQSNNKLERKCFFQLLKI